MKIAWVLTGVVLLAGCNNQPAQREAENSGAELKKPDRSAEQTLSAENQRQLAEFFDAYKKRGGEEQRKWDELSQSSQPPLFESREPRVWRDLLYTKPGWRPMHPLDSEDEYPTGPEVVQQ